MKIELYIHVYTDEGIMFLVKVCQALERSGVDYALVGGCAVALHGAVRGTVDVDIAVVWELKQLQQVEACLKELGLQSQLPINAEAVFNFRKEYIENRNMIAWNFYNPENPLEQVDIMVAYDLKPSDVTIMQTRLGALRVLNKKALIEMKRQASRAQDLEDISALEKLL